MKKGMTGVVFSTLVTKVVTGDIQAGTFDVPTGYNVTTK
jgi:hypothetical protein